MINVICKIFSTLLIICFPLIFVINGYGLDTWQYWTVLSGMFLAHILGMLRMVGDE